jgi:hypothetical protein
MYVVDISDPAQPVEVAHFKLTESYPLLWGVYPKGDLILTARPWETGLYVLRLTEGVVSTGVTASRHGEAAPEDFALRQNVPNPFNLQTVIHYDLPLRSHVDLSVYNAMGQKVATLVSERQEAGHHQATWDGRGFATGIYVYRLQAGSFVQTRKALLVR